MTTQNKEFEDQIDHIGELYENIKQGLTEADAKFISFSRLEKCYSALSELRDIACMAVKHIHQPIEQSKLEE